MTEPISKTDLDPKNALRSSRIKMLAVLGFFIVPFFIAIISYFFAPQFLDTGGRVNNAPLVEPIVTLQPFTNLQLNQEEVNEDSIKGRWTIVHRLAGQCNDACKVFMYNTRQTRLGLGRDAGRVQRLVLGSNVGLLEDIGREHPDSMLVLRILGGLDSQLIPVVEREKLSENDALLIDPLGNIMMAIPAELDPTKLRKDLKKLLKLSKIG